MLTKPKCIKSQNILDVTCVYNSFCNYYQISTLTETQWRQAFVEYWNGLPSTIRLTQEQRNQRLNALIGPSGYSIDVLKMWLRYRGQNFQEMHNIPSVNFNTFLLNLENGFVIIEVLKPFKFQHCVCVKNSYLVDSIGRKVYRWKGIISGYAKCQIVSAIDTDAATDYQLARAGDNANVVIDLT